MIFESVCVYTYSTCSQLPLIVVSVSATWWQTKPSLSQSSMNQRLLSRHTFISHWHSEDTRISCQFHFDHCFCSFFPCCCYSSFFLVLQKYPPYNVLHPHSFHLPSIPSRSSSSNLPLPLSLSFLGTTLLLISCAFLEPGSHVLSTTQASLISFLFPCMCVPCFLCITHVFPLQSSILFSPFQHMCKHYSISQVPL